MRNAKHHELLQLIRENSVKGSAHTQLDSYLGTTHPRFDITAPILRLIAKEWSRENRKLNTSEITDVITALIEGKSATEKVFAGMLLDEFHKELKSIPPSLFDSWLEHLEGWAEVDSLCTGKFTITHLPTNWPKWKPLLKKFAKSKNIHKKRAALALFCSPIRYCADADFAETALENIGQLKSEKAILVTKAISWLLRSMVKLHRNRVVDYLEANRSVLPAIAVRETEKVLLTGKKTNPKSR